MKKNIYYTAISVLLGVSSVYAYFSLYGIFSSWLIKVEVINWIYYLPKPLYGVGYYVYEIASRLIVAFFVMGLAGIIIGITVTKNYLHFSLVGFGSALCTYLLYGFVFVNTNAYLCLESSSSSKITICESTWGNWVYSFFHWDNIIYYISWLTIYVFATLIGKKLVTTHAPPKEP